MAKALKYCTRGHLMAKTRKYYPNGDSYCSLCKNIRMKISRKKDPAKYKEYCKKSRTKRMYGISLNEARQIFTEQGSKCAVCEKMLMENKGWHIDHCHETNKVRGVLCHHCNTAIGLFGDDVKNMERAIKYLKSHR